MEQAADASAQDKPMTPTPHPKPGQLTLDLAEFQYIVRRFEIWQDYGPITTGFGASAPHYAAMENGSEYLIKGASLTPAEPHVAANELISALLANRLGLPLLDFGVAEDRRKRTFFASDYLSKGQFHPSLTESLLDACVNRERVYDIVVFDIWLRNTDRHGGNFLVRDEKGGGHLLLLNDHSRCLAQPSESPADIPPLAARGGLGQYRRTPFVWDRLT